MRDSRLDSHRGSGTRGEKSVGASRTPSLTVHVHVAHVAHSLLTPPRISGTSAGARDTVARRRMGSPALPAVAQTANTLHQSAVLVAGTLNAHAVNLAGLAGGPAKTRPSFYLSSLRKRTLRREYGAGARTSDGITYEKALPAPKCRRGGDFGRDHVRDGPSGEYMTPEQEFCLSSPRKRVLRRENGTGTWGFDGIPYEKRPPAPHQKKRTPPKRGPHRCCVPRAYWMRVRQYGHTFQSALSGRWHVGQTFLTWVLQMGHTTKSRSIGAPHLGQIP